MIGITVIMLFSMDGYLGVNALFHRLVDRQRVSWAASVAKLHESIGVAVVAASDVMQNDAESVPLKDVEGSASKD